MDMQNNNYNDERELLTLKPTTGRWLLGTFAGWMILAACLLIFGLPFLLLIWLRNFFTKFTITNQRVKIESGIIFKRVDEVELYRIKDTTVNFSLLNQVFNIGTVTVLSSDATTQKGALVLYCIPDARKVRETLRNAVEQSRRRRGVRELDVDAVAYTG